MNFISKLLGSDRKKAYDAYKKGIECYNKLKFNDAIEHFEQVRSKGSMKKTLEFKLATFYCGLAYRNLGIVQFTRDDNEGALYSFRKAQDCNPGHIDLNYFIGICLNNIGQFKEAMAFFEIIQEIEPWNVPNKLKMALILHNLKMWGNAEKIYRSLLEKNPNFADVHFHLGLSLMNQGKTTEAIDSFRNAVHINPNYINAGIKLGITLASVGQLNEAYDVLHRIIEKNPDYADVLYLIGLIKQEGNELQEAMLFLQRAVKISPAYKNAQVKLIMIYSQMGKTDAAQSQLNEALEHYPDDNRLKLVKKFFKIFNPSLTSRDEISKEFKTIFGSQDSLAALRNEFHKGLDIMPSFSEIIAIFSNSRFAQEDASISDFLIPLIREQIRRTPNYPDLYNSLGLQLLFKNEPIEAESAFSTAVQLNPDYATARINLLKTLQKNGKHEAACEHGYIILSKRLLFPDVFFTMAQALLDLSQYDEALINAAKALQLQPSMKNAHLLIARIYEKQEHYDLAINEINKYLNSHEVIEQISDAKIMLKKLQKKNMLS